MTSEHLATPPAGDLAREEMRGLEGTWQLISAVSDGQETPDEAVRQIRVVIQDGKQSVYFGDQVVVKEIPVAVNPATDPKSTVDTLPDGQTILGIYRLEGDTLTSCVAKEGQPRPVEFASRAGMGHTLRIFRRVSA